MIRGLLVGILLGVIGVMAGTYWYFSSGRAPVAVTASEMPFERRLARLGLHAYLEKLPHPEPQVPADETRQVQLVKECYRLKGRDPQLPSPKNVGMPHAAPPGVPRRGETDNSALRAPRPATALRHRH